MAEELIKYDQLNNAVGVLTDNKTRVERASTACETMLARMSAGMTDQLDEEASELIGKVKKTLDILNTQRKPITQTLDAIKKEFTSLEALIDPSKDGSIPNRIQLMRSQYATKKLEIARQKQLVEQRAAQKNQEKINAKADLERRIAEYFLRYKLDQITAMSDVFTGMTLKIQDECRNGIQSFNEVYPETHFNQFALSQVMGTLLSVDEKRWITEEVMSGKYAQYADQLRTEIQATKADLLSRFDSRINELIDMESAGEAERQKLVAAQQEADRKEKERIANETSQQLQSQQTAVESNKSAEQMQSLFEAETVQAPARTGYNMVVKNPSGYAAIYMFWFEKEGRNLPVDKIEKTSIGQMKAFCEKYAHKHNEKITSPFLEYKEVVKAR